jgi:protein CpxP
MSAIRTFALAAVAAAALAGSAQAQSTTAATQNRGVAGQRGQGRGRGDEMGMFRDLNLSDAQKTQIKAIRARYKTQRDASRDQSKPFLEAARAARQKGDTAGFRANMEKARQTSGGIRQQEMNEIRGVLTPEQRTKADAAMAQRKQERGQRGQRGGRNDRWGKNKPVKSGG